MWSWVILLTAVVYTTGDIRMDLFRKAMRDGFPDQKIDMSRLLHEYTTICPYLSPCDLDHVEDPVPFVYSRSEVTIPSCKPCDCSYTCMQERNCCPGSPYQYFQYDKANLIVSSASPRPPKLVYMLARCPPGYSATDDDGSLIDRCMGNESVFFPTASYTTSLAYRNKFCAACHNDTDLQKWKLRSICYRWNPYQRTSGSLGRVGCWVSFYPDGLLLIVDNPIAMRVPDESDTIIGVCNVTGLWKEFDHDINWACENMINLYQGFKNVFCYLCNPGISSTRSTTSIEHCNVTGNWKITDGSEVIREACLSKPHTPRLFPFKNIHCMICNGNFPNGAHFKLSIAEKVDPASIDINLQFDTVNSAEFLEEILSIFNDAGILLSHIDANNKNNETVKNITNVIDSYESICPLGRMSTCQRPKLNALPFHANRQCGLNICPCSSDCVEKSTCCESLLLTISPYSCLNHRSFPTWTAKESNTISDLDVIRDILVIDRCVTNDNVDKHSALNFPNILRQNVPNIPVSSRKAYVSDPSDYRRHAILYKNISYLLCNSKWDIAFTDISLHCNNFIDYILYRNITDLLQFAKEHCSIDFLPTHARRCQKNIRDTNLFKTRHNKETIAYGRNKFVPRREISKNIQSAIVSAYTVNGNDTFTKCNQTHQWQTKQSDIELICEGDSESFQHLPMYQTNGFTYKNFACFLCNPIVREDEVDHVISSCNVTGAWKHNNPDLIELCHKGKYQQRWLPFKNFYCSECNLPPMEVLSKQIRQPRPSSMLNNELSETAWLHQIQSPKPNVVCLNDTANTTQRSCHEVLCSPDHYLDNGVCIASYVYTVNVYTVSFEFRVRGPSHIYIDNQTYCGTVKLRRLTEQIRKHTFKDLVLYYISTADGFSLPEMFYDSTQAKSHCNKNTGILKITQSTKLLYSFTFLVEEFNRYLNVNDFEKKMMDYLDREYSLAMSSDTDPGKECTILLQAYPHSLYMTTEQTGVHNSKDQCNRTDYYSPYTRYRGKEQLHPDETIAVDRFLLCPQLEFSSDKFEYTKRTHTVTITDGRVTFKSGYFKRQGGAIRICLQDYKNQLNATVNSASNTLPYHSVTASAIGILLPTLTLIIRIF